MVFSSSLLALFTLLSLSSAVATAKEPIRLPFTYFLLQQPAFEVESRAGTAELPSSNVPMVMRLLFIEADQVENSLPPQGGEFRSLARSIQPQTIEEIGFQRVILKFPRLNSLYRQKDNEAWLVFQLKVTQIQNHNCTQVMTVYVNSFGSVQPLPVISVPLDYNTGDPLLVVNVTQSMRYWKRRQPPSYTVIIKDSTKYTSDENLVSFANYIDCSLAQANEILDLHTNLSSPLLLLINSELSHIAAGSLLDPDIVKARKRRQVEQEESSLSEQSAEENKIQAVEQCHLKEWTLNTDQLGWEWLIFPLKVPLNLCVGSCPGLLSSRIFNATSHAVAVGLYSELIGKELIPGAAMPCCVPFKYRSFSMIIEKMPKVFSLETSSDLWATQCGCR